MKCWTKTIQFLKSLKCKTVMEAIAKLLIINQQLIAIFCKQTRFKPPKKIHQRQNQTIRWVQIIMTFFLNIILHRICLIVETWISAIIICHKSMFRNNIKKKRTLITITFISNWMIRKLHLFNITRPWLKIKSKCFKQIIRLQLWIKQAFSKTNT